MKIDRYKNHGIVYEENMPVLTFEEMTGVEQSEIEADKANFKNTFTYGETLTLDKYTIACYGSVNNLPGELRSTIKENHLLPEILKKQVRFLYGTGPYLYRQEIEEKKTVKIPVSDQYPEVFAWLDSWERNGLSKSFPDFAKLVIQEYYYTEGVFIKYLFNKSRRIAGDIPVRGLEYIPSTRARFALIGKLNPTDPIEDEEFDHVLYGRWDYPYRFESVAFPRFNPSEPFKYPTCINYVRDLGFGEEIYSYPTFYYGLKEWIKGSNLNPKYINSYLRNSLNAKIHVVIPATWIEGKKKAFQEVCETNKTRKENETALITEYEGVTIGTEYSYNLVQQLINKKFREITSILTGEGKNQGKIFTSVSYRTEHGLDEWEFKDIPTKYKEFVTSIIEFDKRTVQVILEGKGVDPSISNVSKEGIFQGSGSNAYYNYIIYLNSLSYAEDYCTADINRVLQLNFPRLVTDRVKLGFFRNVPERQQELKPDDRIENQTNQ